MRIGIVNDMHMAVEVLRRIIVKNPGFELAWTAFDGQEAIDKCAKDIPDLILMDLIMPVKNGVEATREIMKNTPCAILIVTATVEGNSSLVFDALGHGAMDAINTPVLGGAGEIEGAQKLLRKIVALGKLIFSSTGTQKVGARTDEIEAQSPKGLPFLVCIGSSTGGPSALVNFFSSVPANVNAAFVIVQHVDKQFAPGMASWLNSSTALEVKLVCEGDKPEFGKVLFAGTNDHLVIGEDKKFHYTEKPENNPFRPSVDVFFNSVLDNWQDCGAAVILTGIGRDGAKGLLGLKEAGWQTYAQSRESCVVYGMPKAAAAIGAAKEILDPAEIGEKIVELAQKNKQKGKII